MGDNYRSKLRTPKKELSSWDDMLAQPEFSAFSTNYQLLTTPSPGKKKSSNMNAQLSPHKSGYFLRTPSPQKRPYGASTSKDILQCQTRRGPSGTPSPHKTGAGMDLFGNRSLLDGLAVPEWDDTFLDNLFFGLGNEDLDGMGKSPKNQALLLGSPLKSSTSPAVSPFKSPLLTSSPKMSSNSPVGLVKTPAAANSRPLTRQRKLFLQSPERQIEPTSSSWPVPLPFSSLDETVSSDNDLEATTSIQSISTYLKQFDDEDTEDAVLPPAGWTTQHAPSSHSQAESHSKVKSGKGNGKSSKLPKSNKLMSSPRQTHKNVFRDSAATSSHPGVGQNVTKKTKAEPQFTLLRPHTELHNNQICLRMAPKTPPNKVKITRDLSQIQTLPSKEQLRIVRNRFRESLNKAVEQVIEKEVKKKSREKQNQMNDPAIRSALQRPIVAVAQPVFMGAVGTYNAHGYAASKPLLKKKRR